MDSSGIFFIVGLGVNHYFIFGHRSKEKCLFKSRNCECGRGIVRTVETVICLDVIRNTGNMLLFDVKL